MCQILNLRLVTAQSIYNVLSARDADISIAVHFYYAMHFGAKSRTAVLRSLVVRLSIRLSVCQFLTRHISLKVPFTTYSYQWRNFKFRPPCKKIIWAPFSLTTYAYPELVIDRAQEPRRRWCRDEIETPKVLMEEGYGDGEPPQPTRGLGERRKLPERGPGRSPGRKRVLMRLEPVHC